MLSTEFRDMKDLKSILVVVDPTAKEHPVINRASWIAEKTGAAIELFICEYDQYLAGERFFDTASLEKARAGLLQRNLQRLRKLAKPLIDRGLTVTVDTTWDHPLHEGVVRKVSKSKPGIVLKDTHYHQLIRRSLFSNTDWNLIRDCSAPLMLVKPASQGAIKTIIAAVDPVHERDKPAELDHKLIDSAQALCTAFGAEVHIVHAFDPAPAYAVSADAMSFPIAEPINELMQGLKQKHKRAMDELMTRYSLPDTNVHIVEGDTREVLTSMIEKLHADLVVMGAVSRGALKRLLLGSTAELVLDHISCDLLIIKPESAR
jgi:universal stress protein E